MSSGRGIRGAWLALAFCGATLSPSGTPLAAMLFEFVDPNPAPGNQFGATVVALSTGNVVITSPADDAGGTDAGAVYLFNGATGVLISTLRGSTANDQVGNFGVTALSNGNYVVRSLNWDNGAIVNAGAVSWGSGTSGVSGVISAANSLVGSTASDQVGSRGVTALSNGNYVVLSPNWDNGAVFNAGAVSWGSGTSGVSGVVSAANSLVGSTASDQVGVSGVTTLSNGNYVVPSPNWDNSGVPNAGAVSWGSGTTGVSGAVSPANSLVGSRVNDNVGFSGVTALSNGNYVVASRNWDNGAALDVGAATWGSGTTGVSGAVSAANSLVGSTNNDIVGSLGVTALSNGDYVVVSTSWRNGGVAGAGAVTWGSGTTGVIGVVSAANSLVGSTAGDQVGSGGVTTLSNGNYVVVSPFWDNGLVGSVGAATWGSGATGVSGVVSTANSLVGSTSSDQVGSSGVTALSNGNYVVRSPSWDGAGPNVGAATWGSGTTGVSGVVSAANSLVGSTLNDNVGGSGVTALSNGSYVVPIPSWDNSGVSNVGAATWGSATTGVSGVVSAANSLVGSTASSFVGSYGVTALTNGNYVVVSGEWHNGAVSNVGAATWGSGTTGVTGTVSAANSLVGSGLGDRVASSGVTALSNGNYVVLSRYWVNGEVLSTGAATWGSGTSGVSGVVSAANSLVGSKAADFDGVGVTALTNGNYVVASANWDNGATMNAGAATWGSGTSGVTGVISLANSLLGTSANTSLQAIVADDVNNTFIARFPIEGGGRVRVAPQEFRSVIVSALDIPTDQGGWLRLSFHRSGLDAAVSLSPVATYGVWRHVPGTLLADAVHADKRAALGARLDSPAIERLWAALPADLDVREADGSLYVVVPGSPAPAEAAAFPPGNWELVAGLPALQQTQYVIAVPTISNATANDFVVSAHTTTTTLWWVGDPVSGQSVDNLPPATPTQLSADFSGGQTNLAWASNTEPDLHFYRIYRGASEDFTPGEDNRIATVGSAHHADVGPSGGYYKVSAEDVNANESGFALIGPNQTTDVGDERPVVFALEGVWPNPTRGSGLHVAFALPSGAAARLELLDVSGRRVLEREVGSLGAGRHTVNLAEGRRVAPGLYWLRLAQGPNRRTTRVAVSE